MDTFSEKYISNFIESQFPSFYQEEGPDFILFVKAYYEWMEETGQPIHESRSLFEYRDIDETLEDFLEYFQKKYLYGIPFDIITSKRFLLKHILDVYRSKGTIQCYRLLFRLIYDEDVEIYLPGKDILRASDGKWFEPKYLELTESDVTKSYVGKRIIGLSSGTTAVAENYVREILINKTSSVLYISNISPVGADFEIDEPIVIVGEETDPDAVTAAPHILGSLDYLEVLDGGAGYAIGDTFKIANFDPVTGENLINGTEGQVKAIEVGRNYGTIVYTIQYGGFGYNSSANTFLYRDETDKTGTGASFKVGSLAYPQTISYNTDLICDLVVKSPAALGINATAYGFPKSASANLTSTIGSALTMTSSIFGTITSLSNTIAGNSYTRPAKTFVRSTITSNTLPGTVTYSNSNFRLFKLSYVGLATGYSNGDVVHVISTGAGGVNATATISGNSSGGDITFTITDYGSNFVNVNPTVQIKNSSGGASLGTGAIISTVMLPYITGTDTLFTSVFANDDIITLQANSSLSGTAEQIVIKEVVNATSMFLYGLPSYTSTASATYKVSATTLPSNYAPYESVMYNPNGEIYGENENIYANYSGGNDTVKRLKLVSSGKGYERNDIVKAYLYGSVSNNITIINGGTGYVDYDPLVFSGGDPNAQATGYVETVGGVITSVIITNGGSGYNSIPDVRVKSANGIGASLTAALTQYNTDSSVIGQVVLRGYGKGRGYWLDTSGFLNSDKYIQDSYFYQDYSYQIKAARTLDQYKNILYNTFHSSGSELFGEFLLTDSGNSYFNILYEQVAANTSTEPIVDIYADTTLVTSDVTTITSDNIPV